MAGPSRERSGSQAVQTRLLAGGLSDTCPKSGEELPIQCKSHHSIFCFRRASMLIESMHLLPLSACIVLGPSRISLKILDKLAVILQWP